MINELSDHEKTILLAKLCQFDDMWVREVLPTYYTDGFTPDKPGYTVVRYRNERGWVSAINLYDPGVMFLAHRVIVWAEDHVPDFFDWLHGDRDERGYAYEVLTEDNGFARALDRILELGIEAGMTEKEGG